MGKFEALVDRGGVVCLGGGVSVSLLRPMPSDFDDMFVWAKALSRVVRWCGGLGVSLSVAQHSVEVMRLVKIQIDLSPSSWTAKQRRMVLLEALLHDLSEAALGDVPSPVRALGPAPTLIAA